MLSAARESIEVSSGSDSGNATLPDGGSAAESSSPEPSSSPFIFLIYILIYFCPRTPHTHPGTPDGAMCSRSERPAETYSMGKLSL